MRLKSKANCTLEQIKIKRKNSIGFILYNRFYWATEHTVTAKRINQVKKKTILLYIQKNKETANISMHTILQSKSYESVIFSMSFIKALAQLVFMSCKTNNK